MDGEKLMKVLSAGVNGLRVIPFAGKVALTAVAVLGTMAGSGAYAADPSMQTKWPPGVTVKIESPLPGERVDQDVMFVLSVKGGTLVRPGKATKPREGHFYLKLGKDPREQGKPAFAGRDVHETTVKMHLLAYEDLCYTLMWVDGDGYAYGPAASHTVCGIRVKE